ncbi:FtsH protease activity modulator HflK [Paraburkholderia bonniea]|uniref:FtsH protease activity modulator HflK n=1 Tax=Paraburkholderia bonniea TaxID=2152891 RepID=UPI0025724475|nr:FtsH protease activity modulator HflK [Paraburkholderia bonniea]WJF91205.1 FtsH protease activity modulator HflK [Paraburkholderia bonniea]WJF94519.1 FtsH protease activity modulator HflK [Paraburkholderia bonniea]
MNDYNERSLWLRLRVMLSLNDPRWGRGDGNDDRQRPNDPKRPANGKSGEGPPDLDEMWREFNRRLGRLLGRKRAGGGGERRPDDGRNARIGIGIVIGVLIAVYLGSCVFVVQDGQVGVVSQFGKYRYTANPGVHWRLPYPLETLERVNLVQEHSIEIGRNNLVSQAKVKDASMLTHDGDIVDVRFVVQYQVRNATDYLFRNVDPERGVTQAAQAAVRTIAGAQSADSLLKQNRDTLAQQLTEAIQRTLTETRTGLVVTRVTVQSLQAPDQVLAVFDAAAKVKEAQAQAKQDVQKQADESLPRIKADAARMLTEAKTYSGQVVEQAKGDAGRFRQVYAQYAKAPAVIREQIYLDTMQHIYSNTTKVLVDSKSSNSVVYVPLDKLVDPARSGAVAAPARTASDSAAASVPAAASGATAPGAASQADVASDSFRSRDSLRNRSREDDLQ